MRAEQTQGWQRVTGESRPVRSAQPTAVVLSRSAARAEHWRAVWFHSQYCCIWYRPCCNSSCNVWKKKVKQSEESHYIYSRHGFQQNWFTTVDRVYCNTGLVVTWSGSQWSCSDVISIVHSQWFILKLSNSVDTRPQRYISENPQCLLHAYNAQL